MTHKITPIFIISMPRSGSTLLQKLLTTSNDVNSISEPWINLPLSDFFDPKVKSWYNKTIAMRAIMDVQASIATRDLDLYRMFGQMVSSIYSILSPTDVRYFVDKTPRYYGIVPFLKKAFPSARFIYLLRSPAEVVASKIQKNNNRVPPLKMVLLDTITATTKIADAISESPQDLTITYHDLVRDTSNIINKIQTFLSVTLKVDELGSIQLSGSLGDQRAKSTRRIDPDISRDWTSSVSTLLRYILFRHVIQRTPEKYFNLLNLCREEELNKLRQASIQIYKRPRFGALEMVKGLR